MRTLQNGEFPGHIPKMKVEFVIVAIVSFAVVLCHAKDKSGLQIGVKKRPETCDMRSKKGDRLSMHYTVSFNTPCLWGIKSTLM